MRVLLAFTGFCLALLLRETAAAPSPYIVGGTEVEQPGKWPWQVSLQHHFTHICGAVLISEQWIVTAAYCVHEPVFPAYTALLGVIDWFSERQGKPQRLSVVKAIRHPEYQSSRGVNDISLLKLETPVDLTNEFIQLINLPSSENENFVQAECYMTGWGAIHPNGLHPPVNVLHEAVVDVFSRSYCQSQFMQIAPSQICVGSLDSSSSSSNVAACNGDSGSPLSCRVNGRWKLAGVASGRVRECQPSLPNIITSTSYFLSWIQRNTSP